jgi:hypothetical protein
VTKSHGLNQDNIFLFTVFVGVYSLGEQQFSRVTAEGPFTVFRNTILQYLLKIKAYVDFSIVNLLV